MAAFAFPEESTTPAASPSRRWLLLTITGAAVARFVVKTPAAGTGLRLLVTSIATSGLPLGLMPIAAPPASKPLAAVILMALIL
ncbi:unannotated protein [freshwater metagenome]|uniref:Unannotated protein n=1 Tax=freshwater metagenome TaxID=449393 RepID=A0A6J7R026_9ZZZZ